MSILHDENYGNKKWTGKAKSFGKSGAVAWARYCVGGDLCAALLLYRLRYRWKAKNKLQRFNKDWIAMSRSDWAREAGLSEGEMRNRALPKLRKCDFVEVRQMKLTPKHPKTLWMHLVEHNLPNEKDYPWELHEWKINNGKIIGAVGETLYPYKKQPD